MTQVDFYILAENSPRDINSLCCQLCEKALEQKMNVFIYTHSAEQANEIDLFLWRYKSDSFIPHINTLNQLDREHTSSNTSDKKSSFDYPVIISSEENPAAEYHDLLINLASSPPPLHQQFKRIAEIVGKDSQAKQQARNHYRFYQQQNYPLNKYDL